MNNKIKILIVILLLAIIAVFFILRNKLNDDTPKEIDANSDDVTSLVYPTITTWHGQFPWFYDEFTVEDLKRSTLMHIAATRFFEDHESLRSGEHNNTSVWWISANELESNFRRIFGPDIPFQNSNINSSDIHCFELDVFVSTENAYPFNSRCGRASIKPFVIKELVKATEQGDYRHTYFNVLRWADDATIVNLDEDNGIFGPLGIYIVDKNGDITSKQSEAEVRLAFNNGTHDLYRFTFKKQSDGKFYIHSGNWVE